MVSPRPLPSLAIPLSGFQLQQALSSSALWGYKSSEYPAPIGNFDQFIDRAAAPLLTPTPVNTPAYSSPPRMLGSADEKVASVWRGPSGEFHRSLLHLMQQAPEAPHQTEVHVQTCHCCRCALVYQAASRKAHADALKAHADAVKAQAIANEAIAAARRAEQLQQIQARAMAIEVQQSRMQVFDFCQGLRTAAAQLIEQAAHYEDAIMELTQRRLESIATAAGADLVDLGTLAAEQELYNPYIRSPLRTM